MPRFLVLLLAAAVGLAGCGAFRRQGPAAAGRGEKARSEAAPVQAPGGAVAFVRDGDVWVQALPAGDPHRLTSDGRNREPVWSSSGEWILFQKDGAPWLVKRDGTAAGPLLPGRPVVRAAWAPDRNELAYLDGQGRIGVVRPGGQGDRLLVVPGPGEHLDDPVWSPDGQWLAFVRVQGERPRQRAVLARVPAAGGPVQELGPAQEPGNCVRVLGWAPDGQGVLFAASPLCSNSIAADGLPLQVQPVDGSPPRRVVEGMLLYPEFLAVSKASGRVAAVAGAGRETWRGKRIVVWDGKGEGARPVSPAEMAAISPAWAPDGSRLAFIAMRDMGPVGGGEAARQGLMGRRLWLVGARGKDPQPVTADPAFRDEAPRWTADGQRLLLVRYSPEGWASLWLVDVRDRQPRKVADLGKAPGQGQEPAWWFGYYGWVGAARLYDYTPRASP